MSLSPMKLKIMLNEQKVKEFLLRVAYVLGDERVSALSDRQDKTLLRSLTRLLDKKPVEEITDDEIVGQYELVVYYLSPLAYEVQKK